MDRVRNSVIGGNYPEYCLKALEFSLGVDTAINAGNFVFFSDATQLVKIGSPPAAA